MKYVRAIKLAYLTGLSVAAIDAMRHQGKWLEGIHWRRNPNQRSIWYCMPAIERWLEGHSS